MSEGFKQKALQLLVMAVNQGLLDEKSFETHKNMVQIVGGRCIRIYQIRRPQEPAPVAAVAASLGDMICGTGTSQPQPLPTVLMSDSLSRQSQDHPVLVNCEPFHSAGTARFHGSMHGSSNFFIGIASCTVQTVQKPSTSGHESGSTGLAACHAAGDWRAGLV